MKFQIKFNTNQKITGTISKGDELSLMAVRSFGHLLNTETRRNRTYSAVQFAELISRHADMSEARTAAIVSHLRNQVVA